MDPLIMCGTKLSCRELAKKIKVIGAINCGWSMHSNSVYSFEHTLVLEPVLKRMSFFLDLPINDMLFLCLCLGQANYNWPKWSPLR